jgi:hypothetical protein
MPDAYLCNWKPLLTDAIASAEWVAWFSSLLGIAIAYWTLRGVGALSCHSNVLYPRAIVTAAKFWLALLPVAAAFLVVFVGGFAWRGGWVSFPFAQALFRLLGLAAGSEDLSFNERTYLDPATFEAARFQLASHFFDGLLGPFAWAESDLDAPGLMTVDPLADTRLLDATRVDLFLELCAHLGLTLVGVVVLAAVINQVNRLRCNDGDFIERKQVTFRTSFCTMVWLEFMYFGYRFLGQPWDCLARCCCRNREIGFTSLRREE